MFPKVLKSVMLRMASTFTPPPPLPLNPPTSLYVRESNCQIKKIVQIWGKKIKLVGLPVVSYQKARNDIMFISSTVLTPNVGLVKWISVNLFLSVNMHNSSSLIRILTKTWSYYRKQSAAKWVINLKVTITKMMTDFYNNNLFLDI